MPLQLKPFLFVLLLLIPSAVYGAAAEPAAFENASPKIQDIFQLDTLEETNLSFENRVGPAKFQDADSRIYDIDGCTVRVLGSETVESLRLELSPHCSFDLGEILQAQKAIPAHDLTFGRFEAETGEKSKYLADCLRLCGNAGTPSVYLLYTGPRAFNFIQILLETPLSSGGAIAAANAWAVAMERAEGREYVLATRFNDDDRHDDAARTAFQNIKISAITLGYGLDNE